MSTWPSRCVVAEVDRADVGARFQRARCRRPAAPPRCARAGRRSTRRRALPACAAGRRRWWTRCAPLSDARCAGAAASSAALSGGCSARATTGSMRASSHLVRASTRRASAMRSQHLVARGPRAPRDGGPGAAGSATAAAPRAAPLRHATAAPPACRGRPSSPPPRLRWCRRTARGRGRASGSRAWTDALPAAARAASAAPCPACACAACAVEDARDLHGQRRTAGHDAPVPQPLPAARAQRHRIDAGMPPEPAVLVVSSACRYSGETVSGVAG